MGRAADWGLHVGCQWGSWGILHGSDAQYPLHRHILLQEAMECQRQTEDGRGGCRGAIRADPAGSGVPQNTVRVKVCVSEDTLSRAPESDDSSAREQRDFGSDAVSIYREKPARADSRTEIGACGSDVCSAARD